MIRLLFVCHGNICRSPMAESVCAHEIKKRNLINVTAESAAAHKDKIGNPPHYGTVEKLKREGIELVPHRARLLMREDAEQYDYFIGMDDYNIRDMKKILGNTEKPVCKLLEFAGSSRPIADPWYTKDFEATFADITEGIKALLDMLEQKGLAVRGS